MRTLLVLCVLATVVVAARQAPPQQTFHTEANYVRVDAYATRRGVPVSDLRQDDFEVLEDGVPQKVEQFERIAIQSAVATGTRRADPNTVAESRDAVAQPRARVFVIFLDVPHVEAIAARQIQKPLVDFLNRLLGPDDLVAVMTPDMRASDITFAHQTTSLEGMLGGWWGERDRDFRDDVESSYAACYPGIPSQPNATASDQGMAQEMILRRREQRTFDALEDLVATVRDLREERKAILVVSDGWRLFRPNDALLRPIDNAPVTIPIPGVDPRSGKLTTQSQHPLGGETADCQRDRVALAAIDDLKRVRELTDTANRANATFYPIDPRGLVVFDEQIVPASGVGVGLQANPTVPPAEDDARLTARSNSLRTIAENTDGMALVGTNNFAPGLKRITDDLNSYYLLGYYSSHSTDGKFHAITVRVKSPGVQVRARRGYLASATVTPARVTASTRPAPAPAADLEARAVETAIGSLAASTRPLPLRLQAAAAWTSAGAPTMTVVIEAVRDAARSGQSLTGGQADVQLVDRTGNLVASARAMLPEGATSVQASLTLPATVKAGEYDLQVRVRGADALTGDMGVELKAAPLSSGALLTRQGPTTGNKPIPTADPRFRRSERLRVDVPASSAAPVTTRLLDRTGKAMPIPLESSVRSEADGSRWQATQVVLAPLAPGDYVIEVVSGTDRTLVPFRIVP